MLQRLLIVLLACAACRLHAPSIPLVGQYPIATHPAVGCWEIRPIRGRSRFLPTPISLRLDTVLANPEDSDMRLQVRMDTATVVRLWGSNPIHVRYWAPYRNDDRVIVLFGNGTSSLDMRLRVRGNQMRGSSAQSTDIGWWDTDGPDIEGSRVPCDALVDR